MKKRIDIKIPAGWRELTLEQLLEVARVTNLTLTKNEVLFVLLCRFGGIVTTGTDGQTTHFTDKAGETFHLQEWQLFDFCKRLEWVLNTVPEDIVSPLGIDGHLNNISFEDFFNAEVLMYRYNTENDTRYIDEALKILGYGRRIKDDTVRRAVSIWWTGVLSYMKTLYPNVFSGDSSDEDDYDPRKTFLNIMLMLNDDRPQDNDDICRANVHFVLSALDSRINKAKQIEKQMK